MVKQSLFSSGYLGKFEQWREKVSLSSSFFFQQQNEDAKRATTPTPSQEAHKKECKRPKI
jgi:hypothetical protein